MDNVEENRGLNILCIDGGGVRGLSSLLLLAEIMRRIAALEQSGGSPNPIDYFDVIAGSGTGGVSACMLGILGMSMEQTIAAYVNLVEKVFSDRKVFGTSGSSKYKGTTLREALKSMVQDATGNEEERMRRGHSKINGCKTMVFARSKQNMNAGITTIFRSYESATNPAPDCAIWEALYATMAHPDLFKSIDISDGPIRQSFVGGELGSSNPIAHVLNEVNGLYPTRHVSCIMSIGAGHARTIQVFNPSLSQRLMCTRGVKAMKDIATDNEREAEMTATRFQSRQGVYYRLNVDQGMQSMKAGDWERLDDIKAHAGAYMNKYGPSNTMQEAAKAIKSRKATLCVAHIDGRIPAAEQTIALKRCPAPTSVYTGREDQIQQVGTCIIGGADERRVCIVHGLGGAGKTQLALRTIELNRDSWKHVLYVDASSREAIESTLQRFAKAKGTGNSLDDALRWLETCLEPWLVVFDNADLPSLNIHQYFPSCSRGNILITTRLPDLGVHARGPGSVCHVSSMSPEDALELFLKVARIQGQGTTESEMGAARALLQDFGYLALAIVHAGAYLAHSRHISFSRYRSQFLVHKQRMLEQYSGLQVKLDQYGKSVYTTWKMCYDLLKTNGNAQRMFWLIAFLHHDGVSEGIFQRAAANIQSYQPKFMQTRAENDACEYIRDFLSSFIQPHGVWDAVQFSEAISELASYSLIDFDRANLTYSMHVLVQDWARTVIASRHELMLECTTLLLSQSVDWHNTRDSLTFKRDLMLHVDKVIEERRGVTGPNHASSFAEVYRANGRWNRQEAQVKCVMEASKKELGDEHPFTLTSMNNLASTYRSQGRWGDAESLDVEVMNARKRLLGKEHPSTLSSMANLASTYRKQGRWDEAEALEVQVMNAFKRLLGNEHPDALTSMANLASTYRKQGRWDKAESLEVQVMNARKRLLGNEHPDTLSSMANLASTYLKQGRWDEAESLLRQVMNACKQLLGNEHPDTLTSMANLASTYLKQGRWDEAEPLQVQVVNAFKQLLGKQHPDTLTSMKNLASTYLKQGRWSEAESLDVQVMNARKQLLGKEHPSTLSSMANLASTYRKQGRWDEAEALEVQVMNARKRLLGNEHPDTLASMKNLASTYRKQGRWDEAEDLDVQVMSACKRLLGDAHPDTLTSMANLASTYLKQGRWDEAESLQVQVMNTTRRLLGNEHPDTLSSMANLASTYRRQGRWREAESMDVQVMNTRKQQLGNEHPDTLSSMANLASTYLRQGRLKEAESLLVLVINARKRLLGNEHPDTLASVKTLALIYRNQGRWDEAEEL